jgi:type II secretory pathway component GspD/PulD (secretin)
MNVVLGLVLVVAGLDSGLAAVTVTHPIRLMYMSAAKAAERLKSRMGEAGPVAISADEASNTVWIRASAVAVLKTAAVLQGLDEKHRPAEGLLVVRLRHADATRTAGLFQLVLPVLAILDEDSDVYVVADARSNSVVIAGGTQEGRQRIVAFLRWLDERHE